MTGHLTAHRFRGEDFQLQMRILFSLVTGRYVAAAENIKAGELLLTELPAVVGPYWDSQISCVNCYKPSDTMCR